MSIDRLAEHRRIWQAKPVLADVYGVWYRALAAHVPPSARVLEIGAGPGLLTEWARRHRPDAHWIATDLLKAPWNDLPADACALPFRAGAFDLVVGVDVLHHLARPRDFFREAARVVAPRGRVALIEPWVTPFSYPIYRFVHQEGCTLGIDPWAPFGSAEGKEAFDGDGALPWRIVRSATADDWRQLGLGPPRVETYNGFAYLLTLGFRSRSLLPRGLAPLLMAFDRAAGPLAPLAGLRALLSWESI